MTHYEIVKKLIGQITPIADSTTDAVRFENLKETCALAEKLISDIAIVAMCCKDAQEFSVKRAGEYADKFLHDKIGFTQ